MASDANDIPYVGMSAESDRMLARLTNGAASPRQTRVAGGRELGVDKSYGVLTTNGTVPMEDRSAEIVAQSPLIFER